MEGSNYSGRGRRSIERGIRHDRYDERKQRLESAYEFLEDEEKVHNLRLRRGGAMEYDPRQGEVMVPDCVEFVIKSKDLDILEKISKACDLFGMRVVLPEFKQPNFTYENVRGETRVTNQDVDYVAFVRLVL